MICAGIFLEGAARWGFDPVWEVQEERLFDDQNQ